MKFIYPQGATPLDADYSAQLMPKHITTQSQLNEWEAVNIQEARKWAFLKYRSKHILDIGFIKKLHAKMFEKTWEWAGQWRTRQTNIGKDHQVPLFDWGQNLTNSRSQYIAALQASDRQDYESLLRFVRS